METGRTVILLNLENLYESLYDVLNQYYIYHAKNKYVDLGLQTNRLKCRVDSKFRYGILEDTYIDLIYGYFCGDRLILIAEKDTVYDKFPTPLINRLEKHFVLTSSILMPWQEIVLSKFESWIRGFSDPGYVSKSHPFQQFHSSILLCSSDSKFKESDAFIGFQKDTPASVVFQASNLLKSAITAIQAGINSGGKWERVLCWCELQRDSWKIEEEQDNEMWTTAVSVWFMYLTGAVCYMICLPLFVGSEVE